MIDRNVMRLGLLALSLSLAMSCHSRGRIGRHCDGGDCRKPVETAAGMSAPPACEGSSCEPPVCTPDRCDPGCDAASCAPPPCQGGSCEVVDACANGGCEVADACANGGCEVDACAGLACAAPSCEGGMCQAGICDGGPCTPEPGCNASFPICAHCQDDDDCDQDREEAHCDRTRGRCVECLTDSHCSSVEPFCIDADCEECRTDDDCGGILRCRNGDCGPLD